MIPEIVAHLWQSTLFAGAAWLVTLGLRTNRAQVRYWVWFAASLKFLVPYAALVGLGTLLPHRPAAPSIRAEWMTSIEQWSQPLAAVPATFQVPGTPRADGHSYLDAGLWALWACGFGAVVFCWLLRWKNARTLRASARIVDLPAALRVPVPVMSAPDIIEPGVFGVWRPVLLLPEFIAERLSQAQLGAILAHECCHVRRRDNLTAVIHMAVQSIFWFHPMAWWIGQSLVHERERACDEEVLQLGHQADVYAGGILTICKLYMSSPLPCVSGVSGSNLKQRIESILRYRNTIRLNPMKKLGLGFAGVAAVAVPMIVGMFYTPSTRAQAIDAAGPEFAVASIKACKAEPNTNGQRRQEYTSSPGRVHIVCLPVSRMIYFAYAGIGNMANPLLNNHPSNQEHVRGGPGWVDTEKYTIEATAEGSPGREVMMGSMLRALLRDRFQLKTHRGTETAPMYALTVAKGGLKMQPIGDDGCTSDAALNDISREAFMALTQSGKPPCGNFTATGDGTNRKWTLGGESLQRFANQTLSAVLDRFVIDQTGVTGRFNIRLAFGLYDENVKARVFGGRPAGPRPDGIEPGASIFEALEEQLGLRLEKTKGTREFLVIDHIERPSEN